LATGGLLEAYKKLIKKLLPLGKAWETIKENNNELFEGIATEYCRVDGRATDLLREIDPGDSVELLPDWEALLGIPDECSPENPTLQERQAQARQKLAAVGGMSAAFYEQLAASLGFPAVVTDYQSFRVGRQRVGDPLSNPFDNDRDRFRVGRNRVGDILVRHGWRFCFKVDLEASVVEPFRVGNNRVGDPLVSFGNELLECTFKKLKPAHTCVFFTFGL
jgi:uncharacterized protein YmfQ (DUF2313 family)